MPVLHPDHDPSNYEGFVAFHLEIYQRFANTAVEWHMEPGENLESLRSHELGVVDVEQMLTQYETPVAFTIPTGTSNESRTTAADTEFLDFTVSVWVEDYDQPYALIEAQILTDTVVNNVENNRTLVNKDGENPLAEDVSKQSTSYDFQLSPVPDRGHLKYGTARFQVKTKRRIPTNPPNVIQ